MSNTGDDSSTVCRRTLLAAVGLSVSGTAGCLSRESDPEAVVDTIAVRNRAGESQDVTVAVTENEETLFSETYTVEPGADRGETVPVEQPGEYLIRATANGREQAVETAGHVDSDERCLSVRFEISRTGAFQPPTVTTYVEC